MKDVSFKSMFKIFTSVVIGISFAIGFFTFGYNFAEKTQYEPQPQVQCCCCEDKEVETIEVEVIKEIEVIKEVEVPKYITQWKEKIVYKEVPKEIPSSVSNTQ